MLPYIFYHTDMCHSRSNTEKSRYLKFRRARCPTVKRSGVAYSCSYALLFLCTLGLYHVNAQSRDDCSSTRTRQLVQKIGPESLNYQTLQVLTSKKFQFSDQDKVGFGGRGVFAIARFGLSREDVVSTLPVLGKATYST